MPDAAISNFEYLQNVIDFEYRNIQKLLNNICLYADIPSGDDEYYSGISHLGIALEKYFKHKQQAIPVLDFSAHEINELRHEYDKVVERYVELNLRLMEGVRPKPVELMCLLPNPPKMYDF